MIKRSIEGQLKKTIVEYGKMAFVSGPRQVGKTTLAKDFLRIYGQGEYFNWDIITDQKRLLADPYFFEKINKDPSRPFLVVLDEIHKYTRWKSYLKGAYDRYKDEYNFLVTGSGRLDLFKKGGDSLLGRYFSLPLFPLTVGELSGAGLPYKEFNDRPYPSSAPNPQQQESYQRLFALTGFPEPFLKAEKDFYNLWSAERKKLLIREDIRDASNIKEISLLEMLSHLIPERVGAPLSLNSLREDIGVAFETVRDWIRLLKQFYYLFQIPPFTGSLARILKKETKTYLFDWGELSDEAKRFENIVALHLHKAVETWQAKGEGAPELRYIRDKEKREVDFALCEARRPFCLIECKLQDTTPSPSLVYFQEKLKTPVALQLVHTTGICQKIERPSGSLWIVSADHWLGLLP